jgi:hypothetical protein
MSRRTMPATLGALGTLAVVLLLEGCATAPAEEPTERAVDQAAEVVCRGNGGQWHAHADTGEMVCSFPDAPRPGYVPDATADPSLGPITCRGQGGRWVPHGDGRGECRPQR